MLLRAINSVLVQTYHNIELIVVNDNIPGDEYSKILYKLLDEVNDKRFVFLEQKQHINGAAARNYGISKAKGEYIAFQDDDDYWEINKIEKQVALLSSLDDSWGAVSCLKRIYANDELVDVSLPYKSGFINLEILEGRISLGTGAVLIRRKALDDVGYFDPKLSRHQDLQLFARLSSKYKILLDKVYLHNREIKDVQNRPSADKILKIKKDYFESVNDLIEAYPPHIRKRIYALHEFEAGYIYAKEGDYKTAIKYLLKVLQSPITLGYAAERVVNKVIGNKCKSFLVKKYGNDI